MVVGDVRWWWVVVGGGRWWTNIFQVLSKFYFFRSCLDRDLTIAAVFPGGSKKRQSNNDDKHGHGQEKRRPSTCVEGESETECIYIR